MDPSWAHLFFIIVLQLRFPGFGVFLFNVCSVFTDSIYAIPRCGDNFVQAFMLHHQTKLIWRRKFVFCFFFSKYKFVALGLETTSRLNKKRVCWLRVGLLDPSWPHVVFYSFFCTTNVQAFCDFARSFSFHKLRLRHSKLRRQFCRRIYVSQPNQADMTAHPLVVFRNTN